MTRKVLVTGGAGFIGSHVVDAYLAAGDDVTVLDDLSTGKREQVPPGARLVQADVRSPAARELLATGDFTLLNHHAAQMDVRRSVADPVFDAEVNVLGLLNLLEGARLGGVQRVVFASSGGTVYGETARLPLVESAPKLPASPYGTAKLASEYYLATFSQLYGLETSVNDLAATLVTIGGRRVEIRHAAERPGELRRNALAVDKAAQGLGWRARVPVGDGLRRTLQSFREG